MELKSYTKVYFVGIGGIGMSALARWFYAHDYAVAGYDRTESALTIQLVAEGIEVHYNDSLASIPATYLLPDTLIIYTPAIPTDCIELNYFQNAGHTLIKRAEALGEIGRAHV